MFSFTKTEDITLSIFDITGMLFETILSKKIQKDDHKIQWKSAGSKKGIYFIRLEANISIQIQKALILY